MVLFIALLLTADHSLLPAPTPVGCQAFRIIGTECIAGITVVGEQSAILAFIEIDRDVPTNLGGASHPRGTPCYRAPYTDSQS